MYWGSKASPPHAKAGDMPRPDSDHRGDQGLLATIAAMHANLQRAAEGGVIPPQVFQREIEPLGLNAEEQARLVAGLKRLNLRVGRPARAAAPAAASGTPRPGPVPRQLASRQISAVAQPPRVESARRLLARFADGGSVVTARAVDGVVRLTGLDAAEAGRLRTLVTVAAVASNAPDGLPRSGSEPDPAGIQDALPVEPGDLPAAAAAAHAVLAADRLYRNPARRILTAQEEVGLAVLLRGGPDRLEQEPTDEELTALPASDERRQARDCLVLHNQRLVYKIALSHPADGMAYEDTVQNGMLGLLRAVRKFRPTMGTKFSTYATWWVRQSITRAIADEGSLIRIPVHMHEQMHKAARAERRLYAENGRYPNAAETAVACDFTVEQVDRIRRLSRVGDSLDRVIGEDAHLGDLVEIRNAIPGVEHSVLSSLAFTETLAAVAELPERYARIVTMRFGLDGETPATLDQIGKEFDVSRERIRQLETQLVPVLRLAFSSRAGAPAAAMQQMFDDPWHAGSSTNPVSRIAKDLKQPQWADGTTALRAFRERQGNGPVDLDHTEGAFPLGRWLAAQTHAGGVDGYGLPAHRRFALEALGVEWQPGPAAAGHPVRRGRLVRRGPQPAARAVVVAAHHAEAPCPAGPQAPEEPVTPADADVTEAAAPVPGRPGHEAAPATRYTPHWEKTAVLSAVPDRTARRLAEYALLALGPRMLLTVLGSRAAAAVTQASTGRRQLDRPVASALDALAEVLDALNAAGLRPEHFFDSASPALSGRSPGAFLATHPPVKPQARAALTAALSEFLAARAEKNGPTGQAPDTGAEPAADGAPAEKTTQAQNREQEHDRSAAPETQRPEQLELPWADEDTAENDSPTGREAPTGLHGLTERLRTAEQRAAGLEARAVRAEGATVAADQAATAALARAEHAERAAAAAEHRAATAESRAVEAERAAGDLRRQIETAVHRAESDDGPGRTAGHDQRTGTPPLRTTAQAPRTGPPADPRRWRRG